MSRLFLTFFLLYSLGCSSSDRTILEASNRPVLTIGVGMPMTQVRASSALMREQPTAVDDGFPGGTEEPAKVHYQDKDISFSVDEIHRLNLTAKAGVVEYVEIQPMPTYTDLAPVLAALELFKQRFDHLAALQNEPALAAAMQATNIADIAPASFKFPRWGYATKTIGVWGSRSNVLMLSLKVAGGDNAIPSNAKDQLTVVPTYIVAIEVLTRDAAVELISPLPESEDRIDKDEIRQKLGHLGAGA